MAAARLWPLGRGPQRSRSSGGRARAITWALLPDQQGKGYATEAARRALQAAHEVYGWTTAVSVVAHGNTASDAVALRLGAQVESHIPFRGGLATVYRHAQPLARP